MMKNVKSAILVMMSKNVWKIVFWVFLYWDFFSWPSSRRHSLPERLCAGARSSQEGLQQHGKPARPPGARALEPRAHRRRSATLLQWGDAGSLGIYHGPARVCRGGATKATGVAADLGAIAAAFVFGISAEPVLAQGRGHRGGRPAGGRGAYRLFE